MDRATDRRPGSGWLRARYLTALGALAVLASVACRPSAGPAPAVVVPTATAPATPTVTVLVATSTPAATAPAPATPVAATPAPQPGVTPSPVASGPNLRLVAPAPGERVSREIVVQGEARAYEAQVDLAILDPAGRELVQQRVSASAGAPEWGTFAARLALPPGTTGPVRLRVATLNARDGGLQDQLVVDLLAGP